MHLGYSNNGDEAGVVLLAIIFVGICLIIYLIPTIVAVNRNHSNKGSIIALNLLAGWTFAGWVASLVWSFTDNTRKVEVDITGFQPTTINVAQPMQPVIAGGGFGGARNLIPSPSRYLPQAPPPQASIDHYCRVRQHQGGMWYIESVVNPQYAWTGSAWEPLGTKTRGFMFPEGAHSEAQQHGFQVIS